ncbi:MAG TPA: DHH family phosphoesterase [Acetivibrio sp.]|nr:DHH family phosphoesterase [Acetivibrio sp.]
MKRKKISGIFLPKASFYLFVIFILLILVAVLEFVAAIPGFILFIVLLWYNFRSNYIRHRELTKYIENLNFNIDTASKDTLLNFPMPLVVIELDGTIIWYNSSFKRLFDGEELLEKTIHSFVKGMNPDNLSDEGAMSFTKDILINGRSYCALGNFAKVDDKINEDGFIIMMYLIDNTELVEIKKRYDDEKTTVGIIVIDNYDDLMQSIEDARSAQILAEIDSKLTRWMGYTNGIIKKFERDKYLFVFDHRYLKDFVEKKFDILDSVKEINVGNKIPVTLSMGFGVGTHSLQEKFRFANASLDIALGRGGDQVVVKNGEDIMFFGGKTRELEKRTRVKARVIAYALRELIEQASDVLIMGHDNCDIDCLGSALGIYRIAKNRNKEAFIVLNNSNPTIDCLVSRIEGSGEYKSLFIASSEAIDRITKKTLLVIVDTHRPSFTEAPDLLKYTDQIVVIDHHRRGADYLQEAVLTYQETYASSTCELVTEILQYVEDKIKLKPIEAESLYAGIVIDTKNFTFKTGVRTFEAAAFLRRQGVDTVQVKQLFQNDINTYISIASVVRDAQVIRDNIAISVCPPNMKNAALVAAQAADQLISLAGLNAAFVFSYINNGINNGIAISGRSLGDVNVQVVLEKLGGGGHMTVAGAQLQGVSIEEARKSLLTALDEYFDEISKQNG